MVLPYMVTWIPLIYPLYVSIYTIHYGSYGYYHVLNDTPSHIVYPLVNIQKAIEHDHRNSGFS